MRQDRDDSWESSPLFVFSCDSFSNNHPADREAKMSLASGINTCYGFMSFPFRFAEESQEKETSCRDLLKFPQSLILAQRDGFSNVNPDGARRMLQPR